MRRLIESGIDFLVESGFLYLPLLYDPDIEREIQSIPDPTESQERTGSVILNKGQHFVKSLSLHSLVANYERIGKDSYDQVRSAVLRQVAGSIDRGETSLSWKLITIIFQIMPYFIKKNRGLERGKFNKEDILKLIAEKVDLPPREYERTNTVFDLKPLQEALKVLERLDSTFKPPTDGIISSSELRHWLQKALKAQVVEKERTRLRNEVRRREQLIATVDEDMDILLYVAQKGSLEINGFGFTRIGASDDYLIYKRTGEYRLKDYYGRSYLFPDCRVAVPTFSPFKPVVMEKYKHPFLYAHDSGQEICLHGFYPPQQFSAENAIHLLEEGINALLYGYDARRRNGYHSLDRTREYVRTVEFDDYRISPGEQTSLR
ncbi:MAG: hypothetical protein JSV14_06585 [Deltaproteobacteria bacterium]|nr:MAG: hypothetical protein JSV14_06585 [Deltaproteobacteria bacterium]